MVWKLPVVAIIVPPVMVPTRVGEVIDGLFNTTPCFNWPVPVWAWERMESSVVKLLAIWVTTLTVSEVVAIVSEKTVDVVDMVISLPNRLNAVT